MIWGVRKELFQPKLVGGHRYLQRDGLFWRVWLSQPNTQPVVRQHSLRMEKDMRTRDSSRTLDCGLGVTMQLCKDTYVGL